jgi:hypothetical protein
LSRSFGQILGASHNLEHDGNLVVYMRAKGIVPPSSDVKPQ